MRNFVYQYTVTNKVELIHNASLFHDNFSREKELFMKSYNL